MLLRCFTNKLTFSGYSFATKFPSIKICAYIAPDRGNIYINYHRVAQKCNFVILGIKLDVNWKRSKPWLSYLYTQQSDGWVTCCSSGSSLFSCSVENILQSDRIFSLTSISSSSICCWVISDVSNSIEDVLSPRHLQRVDRLNKHINTIHSGHCMIQHG